MPDVPILQNISNCDEGARNARAWDTGRASKPTGEDNDDDY
jgi:hypothetical protein